MEEKTQRTSDKNANNPIRASHIKPPNTSPCPIKPYLPTQSCYSIASRSIILLLSSSRILLSIITPNPLTPTGTSVSQARTGLVTSSLGNVLIAQILKFLLTSTSVQQTLSNRLQVVLIVGAGAIVGGVRW